MNGMFCHLPQTSRASTTEPIPMVSPLRDYYSDTTCSNCMASHVCFRNIILWMTSLVLEATCCSWRAEQLSHHHGDSNTFDWEGYNDSTHLTRTHATTRNKVGRNNQYMCWLGSNCLSLATIFLLKSSSHNSALGSNNDAPVQSNIFI